MSDDFLQLGCVAHKQPHKDCVGCGRSLGPFWWKKDERPSPIESDRPCTALTVEDSSDVTVSVTADLRHLCPHVDEIDYGTVTIAWRVDGSTYELHSLAEYLRGFKDSRISHEQITDRIRHDLSTVVGIELVSVETTWDTAGMEVRCSTSPTPADLT